MIENCSNDNRLTKVKEENEECHKINTKSQRSAKSDVIDDPISVQELIVVEGWLNNRKLHVSKEDGCKLNIISTDFFRKIVVAISGENVIPRSSIQVKALLKDLNTW